MEFIRFGNLTPQYHKINKDDIGYHTPPVEKGFYAFPKGFVELFLTGGSGSGSIKNGRYAYLKNKDKKFITITLNESKEFIKKNKWVFKKYKNVSLDVSKLKFKLDPDDEDGEYVCDEYYERFPLIPINEYHDIDINDRFPEDQRDIQCRILVENKPTRFNYNGLIWHHLDEDKFKDKILKRSNTWVLTDIRTYEKILNYYVAQNKYRYIYGEKHEKCKDHEGIHINYGTAPYRYSKDEFEVYIESIQNDNKNYVRI